MRGRRIIFLDIDGVLNDSRYIDAVLERYEREGVEPPDVVSALAAILDPVRVERLNRIVAATGAEVVAATSWREALTDAELNEALRRRGFASIVVDRTPEGPTGRGRQIAAWLEKQDDVDGFVILDDDDDMEPVAHRAVRTDHMRGLTDEDEERAIAMLTDVKTSVERVEGGHS